jgi:hypothetical protein
MDTIVKRGASDEFYGTKFGTALHFSTELKVSGNQQHLTRWFATQKTSDISQH